QRVVGIVAKIEQSGQRPTAGERGAEYLGTDQHRRAEHGDDVDPDNAPPGGLVHRLVSSRPCSYPPNRAAIQGRRAALPHGRAARLSRERRHVRPAMPDNPLLDAWTTPFEVPPFERIEAAHFVPAFAQAMAEQRRILDGVAADAAEPSFDNTVAA